MEDFDNKRIEQELVNNLKDLEVTPPSDVWTSLNEDLDRKDRRKMIIYISYASAAIVSLFLVIGTIYLSQQSLDQSVSNVYIKKSARTDTSETNNQIINKGKLIPVANLESRKVVKQNDFRNDKIDSPEDPLKYTVHDVVYAIRSIGYSVDFGRRVESERINTSLLSPFTRVQIAINQNDKSGSRWKIGGALFPVYAFHTGGLTGRSNYPNESGLTAWGGSVSAIKEIGRNVEIELGLAYAPSGQTINNVYLVANSTYDPQVTSYPGMQTSFGNLSVSLGSTNKLMDREGVSTLATDAINSSSFNSVNVYQLMGYLEIPIQLVKSFSSRSVKISFKGGISPGVLINNKLKVYGENLQIIGKTKGVDRILVSTTFAVGFSVPIKNNIELTIEPMIKYGIKSLPNSDSHPFSTYIKVGIMMPIFKNQ